MKSIDSDLLAFTAVLVTAGLPFVIYLIGQITGRRKAKAEIAAAIADTEVKQAEAEKVRTETQLMAAGLVEDMKAVKDTLSVQGDQLTSIKNRLIPNHGSSIDDKVTRIETMAAAMRSDVTRLQATIKGLEETRSSVGHQLGEIHDLIQQEAAQRATSDERIIAMATKQSDMLQSQILQVAHQAK